MAHTDLMTWLDENSIASQIWYVKRLSANDTQANGSHQAGPYLPKEIAFQLFPQIDRTDIKNPDFWFDLYIDSHADHRRVRAIYYNNRFHGNPKSGRNETRLTNFGGDASALLDAESTGALTVFAFPPGSATCHVWVCRDETEEEFVEDRVGPVEPGKGAIWPPGPLLRIATRPLSSCYLGPSELPADWLASFPSGEEIIAKAIEMRSESMLNADLRLIRRRLCEFEIFRSVEEAIELPAIQNGFSSIDEFVARAQTILQRRKSRSGRSLELHVKAVLEDSGLAAETHFSHGSESESGKRPDFIFPSVAAYRNPAFPGERLRMLAVKTTCKDRWRQVIDEAKRIRTKHLLTLQEGVSESQFRQMVEADVRLVVPTPIIDSYPKSIRPHLQSLESFIADVRTL